MTWQHRYELGDPMLVLQRKQERAARTKQGRAEKAKQGIEQLFKEPVLDQDTSEQIESLLVIWFQHEDRYRPALGAPRVSPSCRGYDAGEVHDDGDDRDALLARLTAESVEACVDGLALIHRVAIQNAMRNKRVGVAVFRHPMLGTPEQAHALYQEAKMQLLPIFKRKGLM